MAYPDVLNRLIEELKRLPGVGSRTAERLALAISRYRPEQALDLAAAVRDVARSLRRCSICYNASDRDPCAICSDPSRDRRRILVVESPTEVNAFENAGWRGLYHVLQGRVDPMEGVLPGHLTIRALKERLSKEGIHEVVLATSPDFEGDGTALAVFEELKETGVTLSRIARGVPTGSAIEYANRSVLSDALDGRRAFPREAP